ncbi:hypothetical protein [Ottowia testudinis]|uniref:Uncharacterized protein n=1 Tax=Ottowia testudinis TaxID=2816950 RepID=A0A975CHG5_9BURK|nr:hypothetical protein [Ottowia testudinis]QTD44264.1 hypothetical protein J1M35_14220 [Ottowia testudinis]
MKTEPAASYAPRDVLNAPALKAAIAERSAARRDAPEVAQWLGSHFYRHAVGNFTAPAPALVPLHSLAQWQSLTGEATAPDWVVRKFEALAPAEGTSLPTLWWIDPQSRDLIKLEKQLLEFLNSRQGTALQGKLMRITAPQALALWHAEHTLMQAKAAAGWREHQPDAVQTLWRGEQGALVEFLPASPHLRAELAYESQCMRHCLGQFQQRKALRGGYGENYASACEQGRMRLFSYRTGQQQPRITISAQVQPDGRLAIDQIKGKQNRAPVDKYRDEVVAFLNHLPTDGADGCGDALAMGIVWQQGAWCHVSDLRDPAAQLALVQRQPELLASLSSLPPLLQWLAAARAPQALAAAPIAAALTPGVRQALA